MAGLVAINVIGVVGGLLGIFQFGKDNFADKVGLDVKGGLSNGGGDLPDVRLWNEAGEFLGMHADPGKLKSGITSDITIKHKDGNGQQPTYALFSANNGAVCIAYVSITFPDDNKYAWVADWAQECKSSATWYYSNLYVDGGKHQPPCLWIDGNGDQPQTGFQLHWPEFKSDSNGPPPKNEQKAKIDYLCNSGPPFKLHYSRDPSSVNYWLPKSKRQAHTRDFPSPISTTQAYSKNGTLVARPQTSAPKYIFTVPSNTAAIKPINATLPAHNPHFNRLVMSDSQNHAARRLFESKTSVGPDFINVAEGIFCCMTSKKTYPICGPGNEDSCFNLEIKSLVFGGKAARDTPYTGTVDWTSSTSFKA
ncbi:hypothetical protein HYALB_00003869 [Hymenoscyphus albidus]|uniref:Uncharacterized protein n=1 Tax=Hymenoscyphus albidus TaxID=595503 RepID=A0A9N9QBH7_9HELO|nr:hypothetical protein HYALB_00003869 [Hymenoscyphus albidus]